MPSSRRRFALTGASLGLVGLTGGLAGLAGCASLSGMSANSSTDPRIAKVAGDVTRLTLGAWSFLSTTDGFAERPLEASYVRNASLEQVQATLRAQNLPTDKITVPFNPLLVQTGSRTILFDSGNGTFGVPTSGRLVASMQAAGVDPAKVTDVVISHFHGDHINGLRDRDGKLTFANARIHVPTPEWSWWMDDARMSAVAENARGNFMAVRRVFGPLASTVQRFEPGREILPGISSLPAYGHTAGHTIFLIDTGAGKLLYWGDLTNIAPLFVRNPDWAVVFDADPDAARMTRRRVMDMAVRDNLIVAGYHLPLPAFGRLAPMGTGYDFRPMSA